MADLSEVEPVDQLPRGAGLGTLRQATAPGEPADEILARFCLAAGCSYDCEKRKVCDFPCRERLE